MANLADKHDEENSVQLADAEISRILSTLQKLNLNDLKPVMRGLIKLLIRDH